MRWSGSNPEKGGLVSPQHRASPPRAPILEKPSLTTFQSNDKAGPSKAVLQSVSLTRDRQPRNFAHAHLEGDVVFLSWPDVEPSAPIRSALEGLCAKVTRIGHSTSLVQMWLAERSEVPEPDWIPDEDRAAVWLRLAPRGTLEYLERRFNGAKVETFAGLQATAADAADNVTRRAAKRRLREEFPDGEPPQLRPELSVYQGYAPPAPTVKRAAGTAFNPHLIVLRIEPVSGPYRHLDLPGVLGFCWQWRKAVLSQANDLSSTARSVLAGHEPDGAVLQEPHLAFAPLAFVGHEHADGHLLGMGIVLPSELPGTVRREVLQALARVRELKAGALGVWRVAAAGGTHSPWNLQSTTWTAYPDGATQWGSVTPVAFDYHPKARDRVKYVEEVTDMIRQSCVRIGLPAPREVVVTAVSAHFGTPPAHAFPRLGRKDGSERRHSHAILIFDEPVCGPILLGAGRYRGYGFCRPIGALKGGHSL
jgi:CRISPR-associated protein Csb2